MTPEEMLRIYELFRLRVTQEDVLVDNRLSWVLWINAILFGFFWGISSAVVSPGGLTATFRSAGQWIVLGAGIVCASLGFIAINAAFKEIEYLHDIYHERYPNIAKAEEDRLMPSLVGHKNHHFLGKLFPASLPLLIVALWITLAFVKGLP